jgi:hypothetical protein
MAHGSSGPVFDAGPALIEVVEVGVDGHAGVWVDVLGGVRIAFLLDPDGAEAPMWTVDTAGVPVLVRSAR